MSRSNTDTLCSVNTLAEQFTGLPENVGRFQIIKALKEIGDRLGFKKSHVAYLELVVSYTRESDWHFSDTYPVVWMGVEEIAKKLKITRQQVNRIEKSLAELGAIHLKDYGNYRRFGWRDDNGCIKRAYGVDLRPLALWWERLSLSPKTARGKSW